MPIRVLVIATAAVLALASCSADSKSDAKKFVSAAKQDAVATASDTTTLLTELGQLAKNDSSTSADRVATDAQTLHDHLADFRSIILGADGASGTNELDFINAENDLKNAVGSIVTWAGNQNATNLAKWSTQLKTALTEWNASVRKLWPAAGAKPVPTIRA